MILFLTNESLRNFQEGNGWAIDVDGSVAIANIGAGSEIETTTINQPVVGIIFDNKRLMANLSLEGSKISKVEK